MKKMQKLIIIFSLLAVVSMIIGFYVISVGPDSVFGGIGVMLFGLFAFGTVTVIAGLKMNNLKNQEKEDRINKLEDEVKLLKRMFK